MIGVYFIERKKLNILENPHITLLSTREVLGQFLKKPIDTISCKLLEGGMDEAAVVKCSHGSTNYIVKMFQDTVAGKNEALWTEFASRLGIGPNMYYADPAGTYFIMEFVEGASLTPNIIANSTILQNIAKNIALCHRSNVLFAYETDIFTRITNKYKSLQTSGALQNLLVGLWHYIETLKKAIRTIPVATAPCHNDLNPRNIFVDNNQAFIIDWGDAAMSNPFYDIAAFFILNSLTQEQETIFLTQYDTTLLEQHWQSYLSMLKQVVRFEFAVNLLRSVQELEKDFLIASQLPQTKSLQYYLAIFAEQQTRIDAPFMYALGLACLNEMRNQL